MAVLKTLEGKLFEPEIPEVLLKIACDIQKADGRSFLVGGWVRDTLLGNACRDYDVEVYDLTEEILLSILKKYGRPNLVGKAFGVIHLVVRGLDLDFSFPRTESKIGAGHRGFLVQTNAKLTFKEAAYRRDFTLNAMGMELPHLTLNDPYAGFDDLKNKILRHVSEAFAEDSLRILRGVQFASRFQLNLHPETTALCSTLSLNDLSMERLFEEFKKWLLKPGIPSYGLKAFLEIHLDEYFPEIRPLQNSWEVLGCFLNDIQSEILTNKSENLTDIEKMILMFTALLIGSANDETNALHFLNRLTNESKLLKNVPLLLSQIYAFIPNEILPEDAKIRRLARTLNGLRLYSILVKNCSAFAVKTRISFAENIKLRAQELGVYERAPEPFLTGKILMELGENPGKRMGALIKESFELQLDGCIKNAEDARNWASQKLQQI